MVKIFEEMYGHKPEVVAIHAGLECGLFYKKIDGGGSIKYCFYRKSMELSCKST